MKIGYFGSPQISAELLKSLLLEKDHQINLVISNADKARGRSKKLHPTQVSQLALDSGLPLFRFENLKDKIVLNELSQFNVDLYVVFAYGKFIPESIFTLPKYGSINLHTSLLPKFRGASPIQSCLLNGCKTTGCSVQFIEKKMDTGDILAQTEINIFPNETSGDLTERLLPVGIELIKECLANFEKYSRQAIKQDDSQVTHCSKIHSNDAWIDWSQTTQTIHNKIRAMNPAPGARSVLNKEVLKFWRSEILDDMPENWQTVATASFGPGNSKGEIWIKCNDGILSIKELQPTGRKKLTARDFLNGYRSEGLVLLQKQESN